jgi:uncharacterized membrane protein (DUF2068 family)
MIFVLPGMFSPEIKKMGAFMPMIYGIILCLNFISLIGIWHMKKWGVEFFIFTFFLKTSFFISTHQAGPSFFSGVAFSIVFIIIFLIHYGKMDRNL